MAGALNLFVAKDADGTSDPVRWRGGAGKFYAYGTWGNGTITLEYSVDGGATWKDADGAGTGTTFTADNIADFNMMPCLLRAKLASSTNPALNAGVSPIN